MHEPHWAAEHIGKPYRRGAHGPDAFSCWGWVRFVFKTRYGIDMPNVNVERVGDERENNIAAIKKAARLSGWAPVSHVAPADGDIVLMESIEGRHVGVMASVDGFVRLLHSVNPIGVISQTLHDAHIGGFWGFEFWRRTPP